MVFTKGIEDIEILHVLDSLSIMFDKAVIYSTLNIAEYVVDTIFHIPTYPSKNKHSLVMTDITRAFAVDNMN